MLRTNISTLIRSAAALPAIVCGALLTSPASAHEYQLNDLYIDHPWARALPPNAPAGAAYMRLENRGDTQEIMISAHSPIAEKVEVHENSHVDGLMKMRRVDQVRLAPGVSVEFQPGGYHFMLFGLKQTLVAGERFPLTLDFKNAGSIAVDVMIDENAPSASEHAAQESMQHQHH
tara:strand:- start:95 stop:619 length:525 start_codon:yes stop_codon:yes gene_type:complete